MPRGVSLKVGSREVVSRGNAGPIKYAIEASGPALLPFKKSEQNAIIRYAGFVGIDNWRWKFLKRRFEKKHVLAPPFNYAGDRRTPLVDSGEMSEKVYTGKITVRNTSKRGFSGKIGLPAGHPVTAQIAAVMRVVPRGEVQYVAEQMARVIAGESSKGTVVSKPRARRVRKKLSKHQLNRFVVSKRGRR